MTDQLPVEPRTKPKPPAEDEWTPGYRPSNGTEGDIFNSQWCHNCTIDHAGGWHTIDGGDGDSCPIIMDALIGEHSYPSPTGPPEWEERGGWGKEGHHETRCTKFEGPCSCEWARDPWTGEYVNGLCSGGCGKFVATPYCDDCEITNV